MIPPPLPPEITDSIIQAVDQNTLPACALVCSSWLPASRYCLFRIMRIKSSASYERFVTRVLFSVSMRGTLSFVHRMTLHHLGAAHWKLNRYWPSFFQIFAGHLPNLTILTLISVKWDQHPPHPSTSRILVVYASIATLELRACKFPSFGMLRRTISGLPSLTSLLVASCSWPEPSAALTQRVLANGVVTSSRPRLSCLYLYFSADVPDRVRAQQLVTWMSTTATLSTLRTLRISVNGPLNGLRGYLDFFGPSLCHLMRFITRLHISYTKNREDHVSLFSEAANLKTLSINLHPGSTDSWNAIAAMFHSLPSSTRLEVVKLSTYSTVSYDEQTTCGMDVVDGCFEHVVFSELKVVQFCLFHPPEWAEISMSTLGEEALKAIQSKLPKLFGRRNVDIRMSLNRGSSWEYSSQRRAGVVTTSA